MRFQFLKKVADFCSFAQPPTNHTDLLGGLEEVRQVGRVLDLRQELVQLRVLV